MSTFEKDFQLALFAAGGGPAAPAAAAAPAAKGGRKKLGIPASTKNFCLTLVSKLTQYDQKLQRKQPNIYRLGHFLKAAHAVEDDLRKARHLDENPISKAGIASMKASLQHHFTIHPMTHEPDLPPVRAVFKQLKEYEATGKLPSLVRP